MRRKVNGTMRIVIVGGVAGGMSAATRLRRLSEDTEIIVLEKGPYVSFANCGLPYHMSGEISSRDDLIVQNPKQLKKRFNIDVQIHSEVVKIDKEMKTVIVKRIDGEYEMSYDTLLLSPGARPMIPPLAGIEKARNLFTLRNIPDMDSIMQYIKEHNTKKAVVIGAGFIGLETAESLKKLGLDVTIVEAKKQVLPTVDVEMAKFVEKELIKNKIDVLVDTVVNGFKEDGKIITLENGNQLDSEITILSIGVIPENRLAEDANLEIGFKGGIVVDEEYRTNDKNIYAVGDAILVKHYITKESSLISLASPANRQGRQVADIIMGQKRKSSGSLGTSIVRVFNLEVGSTGLTQRQLQEKELPYQVVHIVANSHAGYFPGAKSITLKLLFDVTTGKIYGAQAIGEDGVDKRIDILSTAIKAGLLVFDLPELEFSYAPPFGSAKDPVNMLGYVALNSMERISDTIQYYEVEEEISQGAILIDVRTEKEVARFGKIKNSIHIPVDTIRECINQIPKDKKIIVSCQSGLRSYIAERILKNNDYNVKNLDGAFHIYSIMYPYDIEKGK